MGLDFDKSDAQWSYGGFYRFRSRLAAALGITNLEAMEGFGGERSWDDIDDDLVPFINHSDCDGILTAEEMRRISPRLREVVTPWATKGVNANSLHDREHALKLCDDMDALLEQDGDEAVLRFI